jgi:hypothetical protein
MPAKVFRVAEGHEVVKGYVTYGPGLLLDVERDEVIEIYVAQQGKRGACIGKYAYRHLEPDQPPNGLTSIK